MESPSHLLLPSYALTSLPHLSYPTNQPTSLPRDSLPSLLSPLLLLLLSQRRERKGAFNGARTISFPLPFFRDNTINFPLPVTENTYRRESFLFLRVYNVGTVSPHSSYGLRAHKKSCLVAQKVVLPLLPLLITASGLYSVQTSFFAASSSYLLARSAHVSPSVQERV